MPAENASASVEGREQDPASGRSRDSDDVFAHVDQPLFYHVRYHMREIAAARAEGPLHGILRRVTNDPVLDAAFVDDRLLEYVCPSSPWPSQNSLDELLAPVTRVRVVDAPMMAGRATPGQLLADVTWPEHIASLRGCIAIVDDPSEFTGCRCDGSPTLEMYVGERLRGSIGVHHGIRIRWNRWKLDVPIKDPRALSRWMADVGAEGALEDRDDEEDRYGPLDVAAMRRVRPRRPGNAANGQKVSAPSAVDDRTSLRRSVQPVSDFMPRLIAEGIEPYAKAIDGIWHRAESALLFFEVDDLAADAARSLGWTGKAVEVHPLSRRRTIQLVASLSANDAAGAWLLPHRTGRIFVLAHHGTLCVNQTSARKYSIEPGTLERFALI